MLHIRYFALPYHGALFIMNTSLFLPVSNTSLTLLSETADLSSKSSPGHDHPP